MDYIGTWRFHSIGAIDDSGQLTYLCADEYLGSPMEYIDLSDSEAVEEELNERRRMIGMKVRICDDGKLYMLMAIPEGVPEAEIKELVASGHFKLVDGMLSDRAMSWEMRDGELWYDTGLEGEVFDEKADTWVKALDNDGLFVYMTVRFEKE